MGRAFYNCSYILSWYELGVAFIFQFIYTNICELIQFFKM
jgi:hypothetical protein